VKKLLALALALIMVLSMGTVAFAAATVTDLAGLQAAITAGETEITLNGQITISSDETITATQPVTITTSVTDAIVVTDGTLTLGENITIDSTKGAIFYANGGEIVIDGATVKATNPQYAPVAVDNEGAFTVKSGLVSSTGNAKVTVDVMNGGGEVTVSGGKVYSGNSNAIIISGTDGKGSINISGGTVSTDAADTYAAVTAYSGTVNVTGGTITSANTTPALLASSNSCDPATVTVSGGNIDSVGVRNEATADDVTISGGTFDTDVSEFLADGLQLDANGVVCTNPGNEIVVSKAYPRADYKVKGYDFTTGTKGYRGASYIDEIKINKDNELVIILKENYKLAEDKAIKGAIEVYNKTTKTSEFVEVEYNVKNVLEEVYGSKKADEATRVNGGDNTIVVMDEDGGYVYFEEEMLKGVVKMNADEKTFLNVIYGGQEETVEAIEELLGEEYLEEAIIEYYEFETRAFKNEVSFSYEAYEDDPHFFYLYNDGKLTKIDATYDDDEDVEAWEWTAIAEGTIIVTDVEIVLADEEATKNPDTGANDVVGIAAALAVTSLVAAAAISIKK